VSLNLNQSDFLAGGAIANPDDSIVDLWGMNQDADDLILEVLFGPRQPSDTPCVQGRPARKIGKTQVKDH
jgi:hypothetical protein